MVQHSQPATTFEFVMQAGGNGFSNETKTIIRRRAMQAVSASRRKTGRYGKKNLLQCPPEIVDPSPNLVDRPPSTSGHDHLADSAEKGGFPQTRSLQKRSNKRGLVHSQPSISLAKPMPISGLELLIQEHGINLLDLSGLTNIHIGAVATSIISSEPSALSRLLSYRHDSYLSFVYPRYGHSACLDDAIHCIILRAEELLYPQRRRSSSAVLASYSRALSSLGKALSDKDLWATPEVLCATEILARFELLGQGSTTGWIPHLWGAARLLRSRGPKQYLTDFEKTLFLTLMGPIVCESFMTNKECFLDEPDWKEMRLSLSSSEVNLSHYCRLGADLGNVMCATPGLCKRITEVICSDNSFSESHIFGLATEARQLRAQLLAWRGEYNTAVMGLKEPADGDVLKDKRHEYLGTSLIGLILIGRLLGAISPAERALLEDEGLLFARELLQLESWISEKNYAAGFYLAQKSIFARGALDSADAWRESLNTGQVVERWIFERWCDATGRITSDYSKV